MRRQDIPMSFNEFERRSFNYILKECFATLYGKVIDVKPEHIMNEEVMGSINLSVEHLSDVLMLETATKKAVKDHILKSGVHFARQIVAIAETISEARRKDVEENLDELEDFPNTEELAPEEKEVMASTFNDKLPEDVVAQVRDNVATALKNEEKKSQEIKAAMDLSSNTEGMNESVRRLKTRKPDTLLEAMFKYEMDSLIREAVENKVTDFDAVVQKNKEVIVERVSKIYAIYETMNVFGFHTYENDEKRKMIDTYAV
jgi:hypothetical protein